MNTSVPTGNTDVSTDGTTRVGRTRCRYVLDLVNESVLGHTRLMRVIGLVLLLVATAISCGADGSDYDEEVRNNFLVNCQIEGDASSCEKMLNCIEGKLSQEEFEYEEKLMSLTGEFSDRLADVTVKCVPD